MKRNVDIEEISDGYRYRANDLVKANSNGCKNCSDCCRGMGKSIILDPFDVFNIKKAMNLSFMELLEDYIELNIVDGLILPNIRMNKEDKCSFLNNEGRCSIHGVRPGFCRLFPLGRIYEEDGFSYFLQVNECSNKNLTKVKVKSYIGVNNIKEYEEFILSYHRILKHYEEVVDKVDENEEKEISMKFLKDYFIADFNDFFKEIKEIK